MARTVLRYFRNAAPGALDSLPRTYSAFDLPAAFERLKFSLEVRGIPNGCVLLTSDATGPFKVRPTPTVDRFEMEDGYEKLAGLNSTAEVVLCGDRDAGRLFKAFFAGLTTLGIIADWIEDDTADRVKDCRQHWIEVHRLHPDPVTHFLTLMRCYRDGRKNKSPLPPPTL